MVEDGSRALPLGLVLVLSLLYVADLISTVIDQLPLFGRTLVPIFGNRTLGRNEMIGVILSIVTGKIYDRKKISSYSQNLNGKVPPHGVYELQGCVSAS